MTRFPNSRYKRLLDVLAALAVTMFVAGGAVAAAPPIDEKQLLDAGFKVLVATTKVQQEWVHGLPAGKIRAMQRTGKKYFIYPDASEQSDLCRRPKGIRGLRAAPPGTPGGGPAAEPRKNRVRTAGNRRTRWRRRARATCRIRSWE